MISRRAAVEFLYLVLSGDRGEIRTAAAEPTSALFFPEVYPHPAIGRLLQRAPDMTQADFNDLGRSAMQSYRALEQAFREFLATTIEGWGAAKTEVTLDKIVYGNFGRFPQIAAALQANPLFVAAARKLEEESEKISARTCH